MQVYLYKGALHCETCALEIRAALSKTTGRPPLGFEKHSKYWPLGPYDEGLISHEALHRLALPEGKHPTACPHLEGPIQTALKIMQLT